MKRHAPATERNREAIALVLADALPATGLVLEVASGTGEHAAYLAGRFPSLTWQPSDPDPEALASIVAWREDAGLTNLREPVWLDASAPEWPVAQADAILCINMVHISPWAATCGLFAGAQKQLARGAPLILYGPYINPGRTTAPSNLAFDESLRARNPQWGLRSLDAMEGLAQAHGFEHSQQVEVPANNLMLIYRKL